MSKKEFEEKETTARWVVRMTNTLWWIGRVMVMDNGFCVLEGLISMVEKVFFWSALIKK